MRTVLSITRLGLAVFVLLSLVCLSFSPAANAQEPVAAPSPFDDGDTPRGEAEIPMADGFLPNSIDPTDVGVHVSVRLLKRVYKVGEPIELYTSYVNDSPYPLYVKSCHSDGMSRLMDLFVTDMEGKRVPFSQREREARERTRRVIEQTRGRHPFACASGGYILPHVRTGGSLEVTAQYDLSVPGTYTITYRPKLSVEYSEDRGAWLRISESVTVEVR